MLCSARLTYLAPKKNEDWPRCVKACWRKLPPVPVETGLSQQWIRPNKIPAGRYGYYRCIDQSHGMGPFISEHVKEKGGPRNFYRYFNNSIGNFDRSNKSIEKNYLTFNQINFSLVSNAMTMETMTSLRTLSNANQDQIKHSAG